MTDNPVQFVITLKDVYSEMQAGNRQTTKAISDLTTTVAKLEPMLITTGDHEARIRVLERFRYTVTGIAIVVGGIAGTLADIISRAVHH